MAAIKLEQFGGQLPAWDAHLLPTGQAAYSKNTYLFGGNLIGWRKPKRLHTLLNSSARMAFRIPTVTQTQARAYLIFTGQPTAGDTVTVGDLTYRFVATLSDPLDVLIDVDVDTTADNFVLALTADDGENTNAGIKYGANTVANGDVYYTLPGTDPRTGMADPSRFNATVSASPVTGVTVGAHDFGAAYNLVQVASSDHGRYQWLYDLVSITHTTTTFTGGSNPSFDSAIAGASQWLEFNDPDTNVVKSPIVDDQWNRLYWASPSDMPKYNTYDRIVNGNDPWLLGVPPPGCAPTMAVTGGGNSQVFGNSTASGGFVYLGPNRVYLVPFLTTGDTQITDVEFALSGVRGVADVDSTPTTNWAGVIYTDDGSSGDVTVPGKPANLLNTTSIVKGVTVDENNIANFANPTGLLANTVYWLGFILDRGNYFEGGPAGGGHDLTYFDATFTNGPPGTAPVPTVVFGNGIQVWGDFVTSDIIEARSYVYTWVTEYSEESPPSPPTILDGWSNGTWTVGLWLPPPDDIGVLRNIKKVNLYRTVPGTGGATVFYFVDTITLHDLQSDTPLNENVRDGSYIDTKPNSTVALNDQIKSTNWFPPPANMQGITVMQNGMIAGFVGNEIWFCEPFRPHAWPPGYVLTTDYTIVGLGVTSGALVACTASHPYVMTGAAPANMTMTKGSVPNPCSSRGSILGGDKAVTYASPNGLIQVVAGGEATNTTDLWMTREKWQQNTPQRYARAIALSSCYYCLGTVSPQSVTPADTSFAQTGFTIELDNDAQSFTIWPQPGGHRLGFSVLDSPTAKDVQNVMTDVWSGSGMLISDGYVWYFDFTDALPVIQPYRWKSKIYQQNVKRNFSAMKIFFSIPPGTVAQNATRIEAAADDAVWNTLPLDCYGFIKTYVDVDGTGSLTLIDAREIRQSGELLRIVDGFKAEQWQFDIEARVNVSNVQIATSPKELGSV